MANKILLTLLIFTFSFNAFAAESTALTDSIKTVPRLKFGYSSLIIPATLIGYGFAGLESARLKSYNLEIKEELAEHIDERMTIDDFSQFIPMLSVYGLNAFGIQGKNNFNTRTAVIATSFVLMSSTVLRIKSVSHIKRPDGSSFDSFPSGHTAIAFMGAEFLWQEYKDVSIWYGITGYLIASGTGFFRMYNDRHWLTDVATGAGIGILSTKIAYWISPVVMDKILKVNKSRQLNTAINPFYNGRQAGLFLSYHF